MEATALFFKCLCIFINLLGILLHFVLILHICKEKLHLLQTDLFFLATLKRGWTNMEEAHKKEIKKEFKKIIKSIAIIFYVCYYVNTR